MPALPQHTRGKLVDTWTYAYRGVAEEFGADEEERQILVQDKKVEFKVYLVKDQKPAQEPPHITSGVRFRVECETPCLRLEGTDLEVLRQEAFARCDSHYATKWEKWYLVEIMPMAPYQGLGAGFTLQYRDVERGVAWNGKILLKDREWNARRYEEKITDWPGEFKDQGGHVLACIPATKANTQALVEFTRRIHLLREALQKMITPEKIQTTLSQLGSLTLLPASPHEDEEKKDQDQA